MTEDLENTEENKDLPPDDGGESSDENIEPSLNPEKSGEKSSDKGESKEESSEIKPDENIDEIPKKKPRRVRKDKVISEKTSKEEKPQEEEKPKEEEKPLIIENLPKESNYQVSLINENLLKIRLSTLKSVSIDCSVKDRTSAGDSSESQTNKIQIHPKPDNQPQEVEIIISIDSESGNIVVEKKR